jgi:hypothetical protein
MHTQVPGRQAKRTITIVVEAPITSDEFTLANLAEEFVVGEIVGVVRGGTTPDVDYTIRHGNDRNATGTEVVTGGSTVTSTTTGDSVTVFNSSTLAADEFVWVELGTVSSGSDAPTELHISIQEA